MRSAFSFSRNEPESVGDPGNFGIGWRFVKIDAVYLTAMLKILGVTYLAEFAAAICRDAGYQTIAGQIEVFARLSILAIGMPILKALLLAIRELGQ